MSGSVECIDVNKAYAGVPAVRAATLTVAPGECLGILGPSGAGKTTLLRLVAGLEQPDAGTVRLGGRTVSSPEVMVPPHERGVCLIFQSLALWPHMTAWGNVEFGMRCQRAPRRERRRRVADILARLDLVGKASSYPCELSGGERQRVALGRALVLRPQVLLMDEPLSHLDPQLATQVQALLRELQGEYSLAVLYVSHHVEEVVRIAHKAVLMVRGSIEHVGTPSEVARAFSAIGTCPQDQERLGSRGSHPYGVCRPLGRARMEG